MKVILPVGVLVGVRAGVVVVVVVVVLVVRVGGGVVGSVAVGSRPLILLPLLVVVRSLVVV